MKYSTVTENNRSTHVIESGADALEAARYLKDAGRKDKRLISIDCDVLKAVSVAYKTASGLHSAAHGELTGNIYSMSKLSVATLIAQSDSSDAAFDTAAFELAKDVFKTSKIDVASKALADASGRSEEDCKARIERKLRSMLARMREKSAKLDDAGEAPISAEYVRDEILAKPGKYLLSLPTAYGKTSLIHEPVIESYIAAGKKVVVISHRRSINKNIANIDGIVSYDECTSPEVLEHAHGLKIVVNSLAGQKYSKFLETADLVVIDEAAQVVAHVLGGSVQDNRSVWRVLEALVQKSKTVIMSDADIDVRCKSLIGNARLFKIAQKHDDIKVLVGEQNHVRSLIVSAAREGKNCLVACDVAKDALALSKIIEKQTGFTPLVITAENATWKDQAAFVADPNGKEHKVVIYSPVITSALSITSGHFNEHFGLFSGQVTPTDAIQMLRRDRKANVFTIGLKSSDYSKEEIVDVRYRHFIAHEASLKAKKADLKRTLETACIEAEIIDRVMSHDVFDTHSFERLEYSFRSAEAWLKDHIVSTLPATLSQQGFLVELLEVDEEMSKEGFVRNSHARKQLKKETAAKLLSAKPASAFVAKKVESNGSKDEVEQFEVIRARSEQVTGKTEISKQDAMLWGDGDGEVKITLFRKMQSTQLESIKSFVDAIELMQSGGVLTEDNAVELFNKINGTRVEAIDFGLKISRATSDQAKKAAVVSIFKQLGIRLKKRDGGQSGKYYELITESLDLMKSYL